MPRHPTPLLTTFLALALVATPAPAHPGSGIVVDDAGRVYFSDTGRGVWRIDPDRTITLISASAMHWIALDRDGRFARLPRAFGEWFGRVTPDGAKPAILSCSDFPAAVGTDGNLYSAHMHSLTIKRRTPAGKESTVVSREHFGVAADRPVGVTGIACGPDGTVYLVSLDSLNREVGTGEHAVHAVAPDGSVKTLAKNFVTDLLPEHDRHPEVRPQYARGLAVDKDGSVYVAVTGNRCVMKLTPDGKSSVVLKTQKPWTPTGVDVRDGEVYVLEYDDETPAEGRNWPPRVRKIRRDGKVVTLATVTGAGETRKAHPGPTGPE